MPKDKVECDKYWKDLNEDKLIREPKDLDIGQPTQKMLHFTLIYHVFLSLQIFNMINSRRMRKGPNVLLSIG
jgi:hypothetical protein